MLYRNMAYISNKHLKWNKVGQEVVGENKVK